MARKVLETFNEYFGVNGDIDKLMEDFARRRNTKMEIAVKFKKSGSPEPSTSNNQRRGGQDPGAAATNAASSSGGRTSETGTRASSNSSSVAAFADSGMMTANKPTLLLFGEGGESETATIVKASQMNGRNGITSPLPMGKQEMMLKIDVSGDAPPGVVSEFKEQVAGVIIEMVQSTGILAERV